MVSSNYSYIGSRNPKTILVLAAMLAGLAMFAKAWISDLPEPVSTERAEATVLSVEKKSFKTNGKYGTSSNTQYMFAELELDNGKTFRTMVPRPYPKVGAKLPVQITKYDDGSEQATTLSERF